MYAYEAGLLNARVAGHSGQATQDRAPTSDESVSGDWTGTPGSRYQVLADYPDTLGSSYLEHGVTAGNICFGVIPFSVPAGSVIRRVNVWAFVAEPTAGINNFTGRLKVGGSYYNGSNLSPSGVTYRRSLSTHTVNPKSGVAWTVDDVNGVGPNALEAFGISSSDVNPVLRFSSIKIQVVYEVAYSGTEYVEMDVDPGFESTFVPREIGDYFFDNATMLIEAIVVPADATQPYYIYPSPDGRVLYDPVSPPVAIQVGWFIIPFDLYYQKDIVTEVGDGWFKTDALPGYDPVIYAGGFQVDARPPGGGSNFINIQPWLGSLYSDRILKYNVRITELKGELFDVAGYEQPYRRKVRMKLLLRELVQDAGT
jgi:hypothetical protein